MIPAGEKRLYTLAGGIGIGAGEGRSSAHWRWPIPTDWRLMGTRFFYWMEPITACVKLYCHKFRRLKV